MQDDVEVVAGYAKRGGDLGVGKVPGGGEEQGAALALGEFLERGE